MTAACFKQNSLVLVGKCNNQCLEHKSIGHASTVVSSLFPFKNVENNDIEAINVGCLTIGLGKCPLGHCVASRDFREDKGRHSTRAEYVCSAQGRCLGYWHGPKASPPSEPKSTKEIENKQRLKFKKHSENDHPSQPKEREEVKEKTSSKHHSESVMPLHETNMDESRNNEKKKRTPQDQRRRRSSSDVKGSANRPTSGVVENETTRNVHRSEDVHRAESSLPKKKSKHLQKSKSEGDVVVVKTYRSSTVTQKKGEEGEAKVENPEPSFPSVYELQTSLPAGKRRTLLLSNVPMQDKAPDNKESPNGTCDFGIKNLFSSMKNQLMTLPRKHPSSKVTHVETRHCPEGLSSAKSRALITCTYDSNGQSQPLNWEPEFSVPVDLRLSLIGLNIVYCSTDQPDRVPSTGRYWCSDNFYNGNSTAACTYVLCDGPQPPILTSGEQIAIQIAAFLLICITVAVCVFTWRSFRSEKAGCMNPYNGIVPSHQQEAQMEIVL
ncbi:hypothetical protein EGR_08550 [Echinococcus granulosus]|uniref:Uncharacterized protein n=1 Tax=Echinococcus granulosus TaxID=6210 RepID=W6UT69_ECHGR|nr:hypothetical protein EGR_08550 [Echinococcus granulosus]EUB56584.1 hypothetical protein EGR_08550 [Echinococcus granulosus]